MDGIHEAFSAYTVVVHEFMLHIPWQMSHWIIGSSVQGNQPRPTPTPRRSLRTWRLNIYQIDSLPWSVMQHRSFELAMQLLGWEKRVGFCCGWFVCWFLCGWSVFWFLLWMVCLVFWILEVSIAFSVFVTILLLLIYFCLAGFSKKAPCWRGSCWCFSSGIWLGWFSGTTRSCWLSWSGSMGVTYHQNE